MNNQLYYIVGRNIQMLYLTKVGGIWILGKQKFWIIFTCTFCVHIDELVDSNTTRNHLRYWIKFCFSPSPFLLFCRRTYHAQNRDHRSQHADHPSR